MSSATLTTLPTVAGLSGWIPTVVAVFFGALGAVFLLVGVAFVLQSLWLVCCGSRVVATVVGFRNEDEEVYHGEGGRITTRTTTVTFQVPVFTFDDESGETREVEGMGTMKKRFQKGEQVALIYSPGNPKRCVVDQFTDKWVPALIAFLTGVVLSSFPAFMLYQWMAD